MTAPTPAASNRVSAAPAADPTTERLSFLEKFGFGAGDLASNLLFQTFNMFLLFFYTDGCVEAESESGDMFGAERLEQLLRSVSPDSADDLLVTVERAVAEFRGAAEPFDDATMMAVRVG